MLNELPTTKVARQKLLREHRGVLAAVARKLDVTDAAVSVVFSRRSKSARIEAALLDEFNARANGRNGHTPAIPEGEIADSVA